MSRNEFVETYGGIYEHSPWVAEESYDEFDAATGADEITELLAQRVDAADDDKKLALIRARMIHAPLLSRLLDH